MRVQGMNPDCGHFDLQLCDQLYDVVSRLGLAEKVSICTVVAG